MESKFISPEFCSPFARTVNRPVTYVNSRKALYLKACGTASSHRYLPLGTFCQRAVRGGCITDYASYIFDATELQRARASLETIDLRVLEFGPD